MLIKCPECELQASDKAVACPHCGYPFQTTAKHKQTRKSNRRRRLPNGFGQISEIKGRNLREPFRAMVTVGKTEEGRPISKLLTPKAYFATYNDAYAALVEYNRNPYDLDSAITAAELYGRWSTEHFKTLTSASAIRNFNSAWEYCSSMHDMKVTDIRARHVKGCMEEGTRIIKGEERKASANIQSKIKSIFNLMLDYAVEYELVDKNYARTFNLSNELIKESESNRQPHISFTDEEMDVLWSNINNVPFVDVVIMQCYAGWRPSEMSELLVENVDLENGTWTGGIKTDAGIDRTVPIHSKIRHLVEQRYHEAKNMGSKYLINADSDGSCASGTKFTYNKYRNRFNRIKNKLQLNPEHRMHDPRVQFVSMAKKYNVDEYAIKYLVGHTIDDITEKIYTRRDDSWLRDEIEKIK